MQPCHEQRQEEDGQDLRVDAFADLLLCHAYLLHNVKPGLVFIAFRYLFVINDQDCGENKNDAKEDPQEKQSA